MYVTIDTFYLSHLVVWHVVYIYIHQHVDNWSRDQMQGFKL